MDILVADDEQMITDLITDLLSNFSYNVIVTNEMDKVLGLISTHNFGLVMLDMFFPDQQGIELLIDIKKLNKSIPVLFLSSNFNPTLIRRAFDSGANGYITKSASKEELLIAVSTVVEGKKFICKNTSQLLIKDTINDDIEELSIRDKLTPREIDILKLVAEGLTANEIADALFISVKTVETHKSNIMDKFETNKIIKLIKIAFENNII